MNIKNLFFILFFIIIIFNKKILQFLDPSPPLGDNLAFLSRLFSFISLICLIGFFLIRFKKKKFFIINKSLLFLIVFVTVDIFFSLIGFGNFLKNKEHLIRRHPSPYDMFAPKPNIRAHNSFGFKGENFKRINDPSILKIAFFGGSTGYNGAPPIINRVGKILKDNEINNFIYNFSSTSSNHTQHKHRLLKFLDYNFDLIIFYGGGNETEGYYLYDPRPGFPYNFYFKSFSELNPFRAFLISFSSFFGEIENRTGLITGLNKLQKIKYSFETWSDKITDQYEKDILMSKKISMAQTKTNFCKNTKFMAVIQPLNFENKDQLKMIEKIIDRMDSYNFFYNYSDLKKNVVFTDRIHIDNDSKEIVASQLKSDIIKIISKCSN